MTLQPYKMYHPSTDSGPVNHFEDNYQQLRDHIIVPISLPPVPLPNLPHLDLIEGSREKYIKLGVPLYEAAMKADWKAVEPILKKQPDLIRFAITENYETLLHIAASAKSTKAVEEFVINLVNLMEREDLEMQNKKYNTALFLAAATGNVKTAKIMVEKNPALIGIPDANRRMPIYMAALFAKPNMVRYLYGRSKFSDVYRVDDSWKLVLQRCVEADIFDVALEIVHDHPALISDKIVVSNVLLALAAKTYAFEGTKLNFVFRVIKSMFHKKVGPSEKQSDALQLLRRLWKEIAQLPKSEIDDILLGPPVNMRITINHYPSLVLFLAAKMGNTRFIIELIRLYPDLSWKQDGKGKTIFHLAIKHRQVKIYMLLYEVGAMKDLITLMRDEKDNNMLHMVAKRAKKSRYQKVSVVAFQLQQELLWFREIEQLMPPNYRRMKNKAHETPQDLFTRTHADLILTSRNWINNTTGECMLPTALIVTIVFVAAFSLPGGYNQNTGVPFFRKEPSLIIFVISNAVSLISSSTSLLIFLSIITSRYDELDFLESIPKKLVNGLATLCLSIVTMMVSFNASLFLLYNKKLEWMPITITVLAAIPVFLYVISQFHLFMDVFKSAYQSRHLFKRSTRIL